MANLKRPELKLVGNVSENFKNFELCFNDYCIQANYHNLGKDPVTERADHCKSPLLEISALWSSLPDEASSVLSVTNPRHKGGRPLTHKNTRHKHTREDTTQLNIRLQVFIKTTTVTNNNDYTIG